MRTDGAVRIHPLDLGRPTGLNRGTALPRRTWRRVVVGGKGGEPMQHSGPAGAATARGVPVIVAPDVAERIVGRWAAGEHVADICRTLHLTPLEVLEVLGAAG